MSADDTQSQSYGPQRQWAALPPRQPLYVYPGSHPPPEEGSSLQTPISASHDHPPDVPSFGYVPYNQISRSSSLLPSSGQYSHPDTTQLQYPSYPNSSYSDSRQPHRDYFPISGNSFDPAAPTVTNSSYCSPAVSGAYTSPPFPSHQFPELRPAHSYGASSSLPALSPLDTPTPEISTIDAPYHHTPTPVVGNKRQRPEDQEQDEGDTNAQARGDTALSLAEKLKRACARCRGLKVNHSPGHPYWLGSKPQCTGPLPLPG